MKEHGLKIYRYRVVVPCARLNRRVRIMKIIRLSRDEGMNIHDKMRVLCGLFQV